jgi:predicted metalloprotease with PDZ domain
VKSNPWALPWMAALFALAQLVSPGATGAEEGAGQERVWLGVLIDDRGLDGGIYLIATVPGGPADRGGLRRGDLLLEADGRALLRDADLSQVLSGLAPGDPVRLKVLRGGQAREVRVELARRPASSWSLPAGPPPAPPASPAPHVASSLLAEGVGLRVVEVTPDLRAYYGAPEGLGLLVTEVRPGLAAEQAGMQVGDVLVQLGEVGLRNLADAQQALSRPQDETAVVEARLVRDHEWTRLRFAIPAGLRPLGPAADVPREAPAAGPPVRPAGPRLEALERSIVAEIEQLQQRLLELERRLQQVRESRRRSEVY